MVEKIEKLLPEGMFLVEVTVRGEDVEVVVDSDTRVSIDDCVRLAKGLEMDEVNLTVTSAGVGSPLKVARQFQKMVGRKVEIAAGGKKSVGEVVSVGDGTMVVKTVEKVQGKKRPEMVEVEREVRLDEAVVREYIDFK